MVQGKYINPVQPTEPSPSAQDSNNDDIRYHCIVLLDFIFNLLPFHQHKFNAVMQQSTTYNMTNHSAVLVDNISIFSQNRNVSLVNFNKKKPCILF